LSTMRENQTPKPSGMEQLQEFVWKGDPHAKQVQRAALLVFACTCIILTIIFVSDAMENHFEGGSKLAVGRATLLVFIAIRFIRNAFLRPKHTDQKPNLPD
jgi:hypothetical protein